MSFDRRFVDRILCRALELSPEELPAFLDEACEGDAALRGEVERLMAYVEEDTLLKSGGALEGGVWEQVDASREVRIGLAPGDRVGPYRILHELGRGGMGVVYCAERADGGFEQRVALKLLRYDSASEEVLLRFAQERQILAALDHPGIARLLDGGATADGRPFFAMELVEGLPIDEYCDHQRLSVTARLELFAEVVRAVQHAHSRLIVHRDLKPSNVLVTEGGQVKLLDFGIAKLTEPQAWPSAAPRTRTTLLLLTPEYASPEQVRGEAVTTATDVYQLGLLLYELLAGRRPFDLETSRLSEIERLICQVSPPAPSSAVTTQIRADAARADTVSRARGLTPSRLRRKLAGELDIIVLMALRKEPQRRYPSAEAFLRDLEHYLEGRPVTARPATLTYRLRKLVQRNARVVLALAAVLITALTLILVYTHRLGQERQRVAEEAERAQRVASFLGGILESADPYALGGEVSAEALADQGAARLETELAGQPEERATVSLRLGDLYLSLGLPDRAEELFTSAREIRGEIFGESAPETAVAKLRLGRALKMQGSLGKARPLVEEALGILEPALGDSHPEVALAYRELATVCRTYGERERALQLQRRALTLSEKAFGGEHPEVAENLDALARLLFSDRQIPEALRFAERSLEIFRSRYGDRHPRVAQALRTVAVAQHQMGDQKAARQSIEATLAIQREVLGETHPEVSHSLKDYSEILYEIGDHDGAVETLKRALQVSENLENPDDLVILSRMHHLVGMLRVLGRYEEALPLSKRSLAAQERTMGRESPHLVETLLRHAWVLAALGRIDEASPFIDRAQQIQSRHPDATPPTYSRNLRALAEAFEAAGRPGGQALRTEADRWDGERPFAYETGDEERDE